MTFVKIRRAREMTDSTMSGGVNLAQVREVETCGYGIVQERLCHVREAHGACARQHRKFLYRVPIPYLEAPLLDLFVPSLY